MRIALVSVSATVNVASKGPATRRATASRLRRDSEDSLSGASGPKEDLTKDMPNPPQPLKVEEVTKQLSQQSSSELSLSPADLLAEGQGSPCVGV